MFHLFHKWEKSEKFFTKANKVLLNGKSVQLDVIIYIEKCRICDKERAYFTPVGKNESFSLDIDYAKYLAPDK